MYLNSKYKEILVKNSGKNDDVIKGAIESFGSLWIPIMEDIKNDQERNSLISKIENYLQKTIEILEKGEINNSQNLVVDSKIKNNESKFINTEDLEIKDEKLNKNNSEVLDMKDEFEFVDVKDENEQVNEDDEPIKSKTSIDKILINEIMKAEIKNDYIKNDNNINLVREKSKNVSSETITVQEYLQKFHEYKIYLPFFQRNYTWDPGLIANFFDLIFKEFDTNENFLFLNTIIFAEKKASEGFWIVDGQQRTVSILLILISILKMASHFGENIFFEMSSIYQTISKILENFSKNNSQYIPLLNYFKNNEKMDNTIFSRNIHKIIEKLCEIKTNKNSVDWINDFTNFILNKILLTLIRISEIKDKQFAKLFISINVQSKPIHVVDLITSRVNEESQQEQIPYVKLIQQYFGGEKENKKKLGAFLQNQQYFIEDEFNTQNTENNLFSLYQQLDNLLNKWTNKIEFIYLLQILFGPRYHFNTENVYLDDPDYFILPSWAKLKLENFQIFYFGGQEYGLFDEIIAQFDSKKPVFWFKPYYRSAYSTETGWISPISLKNFILLYVDGPKIYYWLAHSNLYDDIYQGKYQILKYYFKQKLVKLEQDIFLRDNQDPQFFVYFPNKNYLHKNVIESSTEELILFLFCLFSKQKLFT